MNRWDIVTFGALYDLETLEAKDLDESQGQDEITFDISFSSDKTERNKVKVPVEIQASPADAFRLQGVTAEFDSDSSEFVTVRGEVLPRSGVATGKGRYVTVLVTIYNAQSEVVGALEDEEMDCPSGNFGAPFTLCIHCSKSHGAPSQAKIRFKSKSRGD